MLGVLPSSRRAKILNAKAATLRANEVFPIISSAFQILSPKAAALLFFLLTQLNLCYFPRFMRSRPEELAREKTDGFHEQCGWILQNGRCLLQCESPQAPMVEIICLPIFSKIDFIG